MKVANVRIFLICTSTLIIAAVCKQSPKHGKNTPAEPTYYYGMEETVFINTTKYFVELPLDENGYLDVSALKMHCGITVRGLISNSTKEEITIFKDKLKPKKKWNIFDFYTCVDTQPSLSLDFTKSSISMGDIMAITLYEVQKLKTEQMKNTLENRIVALGEAAAEWLQREQTTTKKRTSSTIKM